MILPYIFLVRIKTLVTPKLYLSNSTDTPLFNWFISYFDSSISQSLISIFLVFIQAVAINRLVIRNRISQEQSLVTGVFYALFISLTPSILSLTPQLVSITFIIASISNLFQIYGKRSSSSHTFNVGVFISFASLFYYPAIFFFIIGILGFIMLKSINFKGLMQLLIGGLFPYFILAVYCFYYDSMNLFLDFYQGQFIWFNNLWDLLGNYYLFVLFSIMSLASLLMYRTNTKSKSIQTQEKIDLLYIFLVLFLLTSFVINNFLDGDLLFMIIPLSIFFTLWLLRIKNSIIIEFVHLGLLVLLFSLHFIL